MLAQPYLSAKSHLLLVAVACCGPTITFAQQSLSGLSTQCQSACPSAASAYASMSSSNQITGTTNMAAQYQTLFTNMLNTMCQHKTAFTCMANNAACSSTTSTSSNSGMNMINQAGNPQVLASQMDCFCDACPAYKAAYGQYYGQSIGLFMTGFMNAFSGLMNAGSATTATTTSMNAYAILSYALMCPMIHVMPCLASSPICSSTLSSLQGGSNVSGMMSIPPGATSQLVAQCNSMGFTAASSPVSASKAMERSPMSPVAAALLLLGIQWIMK